MRGYTGRPSIVELRDRAHPVPTGVYPAAVFVSGSSDDSPRTYGGMPRHVKLTGVDAKFTTYLRGIPEKTGTGEYA